MSDWADPSTQMCSRSIDLSDEAELDIRDVLRASLRAWGPRQRDRYKQRIMDAMDRLVDFLELGQRVDQLSAGLRAYRIEHHIIYYRVMEREIRIIRLLHSTMDAASILNSEST